MSSVDRSLLAIYSGEQSEHLTRMRALLDDLANPQADLRNAAVDGLMRRLHTLKGAARVVGLETTEQLAHRAEDVVTHWRAAAPESMEPVRRALERMTNLIEDILAAAVEERTPPDGSDVWQMLSALDDGLVESAEVATKTEPPETRPVEAAPAVPLPAVAAPEMLRIGARGLDDLLRASAALLMGPSGGDAVRAAAHATKLEETVKEWQRLRRACSHSVRDLERLPEFQTISACLAFVDNRLTELGREAHALQTELENSARTQRERAGRVYEDACRIRMTPVDVVFGSFGPMVRNLAQQEGKVVEFQGEGMGTNADLVVLQGLKDAVMHLLRNAVSHGIEPPDERVRRGKNPAGEIRLRVGSRGDRLWVAIEDDGRGLKYADIAREARNRGLLNDQEEPTDPEDIARLVFQAGFSTSPSVTGISGRGIGLTIAQRAVQHLHGEIAVKPRAAGGTSFVLSVPISISAQHVLLVSVGGHTFGVSTAFVDGLVRIKPPEIRVIHGREFVAYEGKPVRLARLAAVLGVAAAVAGEGAEIPCMLLNLSGSRLLIATDGLVDEREAVIKDTGLPEAAARLTAGAIPMEDGSVAVMLNVNSLFEIIDRKLAGAPAATPVPLKTPRKLRILVVDDSLTTRSLEKSILEAHGFEVSLAVDGLNAWERLRLETPDLVISDVSMPRMTGFQLLEKIKADATLKKIPVILVTSLESREEQQTGLSLGADAYIVKRKFDQRELLNVIRQVI